MEQQAQLVFGTAAESMQMMSDLPPKVAILRASALQSRPTDADDIGALQYLGRAKAPGRQCKAISQKEHSMKQAQSRDPGMKLTRKKYEKELRKLQGRLCDLQAWVKHKGLRVIIVFEGRDAAGKGGTIRALTERVSPRVFRTIALPAPSDREKSQMYMQRYMQHFPAAGEIVIFDRSWYNRAGVEYVMGFCTKEQHARFLELCPEIEKYMVDGGIQLIKIWLESSDKEQKRRFEARMDDPLRQWKLSPMDLPSRSKWFDYSRARDLMLKATDTKHAPWHILRSDDKKRARLNCLAHLLNLIPYKKVPPERVMLPKRPMKTPTTTRPPLRAGSSCPKNTERVKHVE